MAQTVLNDVLHGSECHASARRRTCFEVGDDLLRRPLTDAFAPVRGEVWGIPSADRAALKLAAPVRRAEKVALVVAFAAMTEALDNIGAAIDRVAFGRISLELSRPEERRPPRQQAFAHIERVRQLQRLCWRVFRWQRKQVCLDRQSVIPRHLREPGERKRWIKIGSIAPDAFVHGAIKNYRRSSCRCRLLYHG